MPAALRIRRLYRYDSAMSVDRLFDRAIAPVERLVEAMGEPSRRERTVAAVLTGYVAIWTLYAVLSKASQDMHADVTELVTWSRELALGYPKHPPLGAWLTAVWTTLFPVTDWSFYLLAMTVAGMALWIAWRLSGDYLEGEKRVLALALLMLIPLFNFHAIKFNVNTILMPLWGLTTLCFLRSYEQCSPRWAALAGLCAAAAVLGTYWSIVLLAGLVIAALLDTRRAAYFRSVAPWITVGVGAALLAPHAIWLVQNDFAPLQYANYVHGQPTVGPLRTVLGYMAGSAAYMALAVVLALSAIRPTRAALRDTLAPATPSRRLVVWAFWLPLLLPVLVIPLGDVKVSSLWSMSMWTLLPVVLLSSPLIKLHRQAMLTVVAVAMILPPIMVAAAPAIAMATHRRNSDPSSEHYRLLAERVLHEWRCVTQAPLVMVGGSGDLAMGVAFYLPGRPSAAPDFRVRLAPWVDRERLRRDGVAIIVRDDALDTSLGRARMLGAKGTPISVEVARTFRGVTGPSVRYTIVIVPPHPSR
jgi:4-amino-4-deoxy-L-arabinose transferase-like glycosyltransferase